MRRFPAVYGTLDWYEAWNSDEWRRKGVSTDMANRWARLAALVVFVGFCASAGSAVAGGRAGAQAAAAEDAIDVSRLPIDLERIHRELRASNVREERDGLNLRYYVEVYGQSPRIVIFGPDANLTHGPVPYGGPTHREMLEQMTPQEFRAPAADFSALLRWLVERAQK